jgi:hypothetical protein
MQRGQHRNAERLGIDDVPDFITGGPRVNPGDIGRRAG